MKQVSREFNIVDYGHNRKTVLLKLKHTIFFGNYKSNPEYLGQLSTSPTDIQSPLVYSRTHDHKLVIIDYQNTSKRKVLHRLVGHEAPVTVVKALSRDCIVSADSSGTLILWNISKNQMLIKKQEAHLASISDIQIIDDKNFVTAGLDNRIKIWNIDKLLKDKDYTELLVTEKPVEAVCVVNEKEFLFVERHDDRQELKGFIDFRVFKIHTEVRVQELMHQYRYNKSLREEPVTKILLLPNGKLTTMTTTPTGGHISTDTLGSSHLFSSKKQNLLLSGRVITWESFEKESKLVVYELPFETQQTI